MKTLPHMCEHCGSTETQAHCENLQCTWAKCTHCSKLTDVRGQAPEEV